MPLQVAEPLDSTRLKGLKLGLVGDHQYVNAGLAIALCCTWLKRMGYHDLYMEQMVCMLTINLCTFSYYKTCSEIIFLVLDWIELSA